MKEVIKYLERLKSSILSISELRRQHSALLDLIQNNGDILTDKRIEQMRNLNNKVGEIIADDNFLNFIQ